MFVLPCQFPISFLRDIHDLSYLYSPLGIQDNTCLFCSPRQFGTGEFLPPQHNRRTIPSGSRLQAHQVRHCGALAFAHTITSSFHFSLLFSRARRLESFLSAISSATPPLQHYLSNTTSPTPPLQHYLSNTASQPVVVVAVPCILNPVKFVCRQLMQLHYRGDSSPHSDHAVQTLNHNRCARAHSG
jgi:hypothetical protein